MLLRVPGQVDVEALVLRVLLDLGDGPVGVPVGRVVQPGQQLGGGGAVVVPEVEVAGVLPGHSFQKQPVSSPCWYSSIAFRYPTCESKARLMGMWSVVRYERWPLPMKCVAKPAAFILWEIKSISNGK